MALQRGLNDSGDALRITERGKEMGENLTKFKQEICLWLRNLEIN